MNKRILLVDDDPDLLRLLSLRLAAAGYQVMPAASGIEALAQLVIFRPHLVITDLRMDGMDGLALSDAIHLENPTLPIIILTAHGTIPDAVAATRRGVFGFLVKPVDRKELMDQIAAALSLAAGGNAAAGESWREDIVTRSALMEDVLARARLTAEGDAPVLLAGETGTGKQLLARAIHRASARKDGAFVAVNCAADAPRLAAELLEGGTPDLWARAEGGVLFLAEPTDLPGPLQARLAELMNEKAVREPGGGRGGVRVIAATRADPTAAIEAETLRADLFYQLNVVSIALPPLAERREDVPLLAVHFLRHFAAASGKRVTSLAPEAMTLLSTASWPGNVRQLRNVLEQAVALATAPVIPAALIRRALAGDPFEIPSLRDAKSRFEQHYLIRLLQITHGNVSQAARLAKRNRTEFYKLLHRHRLDPTSFKLH